jgi:putative membrane protein
MKQLWAVASLAMLAAAPSWAQGTSNPQQLNNEDKQFINKVENGNLAEAALGQLAQQKAADPAVKEFGRWMATDHALANKQLMAVAKDANYQHQPALTEKDKALEQQLQPLSGAQFDEQYMKGMVQDHQQTIALFQAEAQSGQYQQLKTYAQNLLPVLQQHLAEAQELAGNTRAVGSSTPPKARNR